MKAAGFARKFADLSRSKNEGIAALFRVFSDTALAPIPDGRITVVPLAFLTFNAEGVMPYTNTREINRKVAA